MKSHSDRKHEILNCMSCLPIKMLRLYDLDNLTQFVLYDLCGKNCFNLHRAAYFVNNPDFNCLKGVAGFYTYECQLDQDINIWNQPDIFTNHMQQSEFNKKVRNIVRCSFKEESTHEELAHSIAQELDFQCHGYCSWNMKYNNNGLLIYQKSDEQETYDDILQNGAPLLSFCPIL